MSAPSRPLAGLLSPQAQRWLERDQRTLGPEVDRLLRDLETLPPDRLERRLRRIRARIGRYQQLVAGLLELLEEEPPPPS